MTELAQILDDLLSRIEGERQRLDSPDAQRQFGILISGRANLAEMPDPVLESYRVAIQAFCYAHDFVDLMRDAGLGPAYNYREEYGQEPPSSTASLELATSSADWSLLGRSVGFPIGVPASVLTRNSRWIEYFSDQGFQVLTFKTVRSREWKPNNPPNWVYLEDHDEPLAVDSLAEATAHDTVAHGNRDTYLRDLRAFSTANSFGVPSDSPGIWQDEVRKSIQLLGDGKLLIVSVMGSSEPGDSAEALRDDFIEVTRLALETDPPAIELNLSCPNTLDPSAGDDGVQPPLCESVDVAESIVRAVAEEVDGAVPLVAKLSYMPQERLRPLVRALAPYVSAFSGINTLQARIETPTDGGATFGERKLAGLSGVAIRHLAVDFVRSLKTIREQDAALSYEIIAMGGVMDPIDVHVLMAIGADAVQTATAASINPDLPREIAEEASSHPARDLEIVQQIRETLYADDGSFRSPAELAELLHLDRDAVERELNPLGELDLPRRVFELVALGLPDPPPDRERLGLGGSGPSPERMEEIERDTQEMLDRQRSELVASSVTLQRFADLASSPLTEVIVALERGELISLDGDGGRLLPTWQLRDDEVGGVLPGLPELRQAFALDVVALDQWIKERNRNLDGRTPRQALMDGDTERVIDAVAVIGADF